VAAREQAAAAREEARAAAARGAAAVAAAAAAAADRAQSRLIGRHALPRQRRGVHPRPPRRPRQRTRPAAALLRRCAAAAPFSLRRFRLPHDDGPAHGSVAREPTPAAAPPLSQALAALRASDFTLVEASELRKGGHVLLAVGTRDEPCKITELTTSKTGKHGHAKIAVVATDVASGRKIERNLRADERVTVPGKRWLMAIGPVAIE
jgi:hypothetical protein